MHDAKEIIRQVKRIELSTRHLVDGLIAGNYRSIFKGQGMELADIREYVQGDDVRAIDWKVTARHNKPFVREFTEERDLTIYFLIDASASGRFGNLTEKKQRAAEIAASLMFAAVRNNDHVGMLLFTDRAEKFVPARKGRKHVMKLLSILVSQKPESRKTSIKTAMAFAAKAIKKRSVIFIISDFLASHDFGSQLSTLRRRHDIIAIKIRDEREQRMPDVGLIELEDEETGEQLLVDTSDSTFREKYGKTVEEHDAAIEMQFRKAMTDLLSLSTEEKFETPLRKLFRQRKVRR